MSWVLLVLSGAEGDCEYSTVQMCQQLSNFQIKVASPIHKDFPKFLNQFDFIDREILSFDNCNLNQFSGVFIPSCEGSMEDLHRNAGLRRILNNCLLTQIGYSVSALGSAMTEKDEKKWSFESYRMTGISMMEVVRETAFANCPVIMENFIRDHAAYYSCTAVDLVHVVTDRLLVTGQNNASSALAAHSFSFLLTRIIAQ